MVLPFWAFLWKEASVEVMDEVVTADIVSGEGEGGE